jgi:hypothetical protein
MSFVWQTALQNIGWKEGPELKQSVEAEGLDQEYVYKVHCPTEL